MLNNFEKITKKEFIETLSTEKNVFLGSFISLNDERKEKILKTALNYSRTIETSDPAYVRYCKHKQSNAIQFSNGSWLYFNGDLKNALFYKHNNIILSYKERVDRFSNDIVYDIMIYLVG